ncbi:hypothetical protein ACFL9T_14885 [Thermodesulfobacteriota bacterium]
MLLIRSARSLITITGLVVFFVIAGWGCSAEDDVSAIRGLIETAVESAEIHEIGEIIDLTSDDFQALPGNLNRKATAGVLWRTFRHYGDFKIIHPQPGVDLEPESDKAKASFPFLIVKKEHAFTELEKLYKDPKGWIEAVGESADLYRIELQLTGEGGDWLVRKATLERFRGVGFKK